MKNDYLIVRTLRKVEFTVFCVDADQKQYYDKQFGVKLPYSSGQQTKRSIMESILNVLNLRHAPIVYNFEVNKDKLEQKEITQPCDPTYTDQLIGGWMSTPAKKGGKNDGDDEVVEATDKNAYKRRSPFSISAMTAVHPLLASLVNESKMTFDRTDSNDEIMVVRDSKGKEMDEDAIKAFLEKSNSKLTKRKLIQGKDRANGFFKLDVAIDLRKLFRVPILLHDMEMSEDTAKKLKSEGWIEVNDNLGTWLELPKKYHVQFAEAIAWGIVNWKITSNQSRTYDAMPVLSVAISQRADEIPNVIRGEIDEIDGKIKGKLVVDTNYPNTKVYSTNLLKGYLKDAETSYTAIDDAVNHIKNVILDYYGSNDKSSGDLELI